MRKRMPQRSPQRSQRGNVKNDSAIRRQVDAVVGVRSDQRLQPARDRRRRNLGSAHVETAGCGFLADRRPPILFEGHIFSRETNRQFDAQGDISNPAPGGYGAGGTRQYDRLEKAMKLQAALRSASWRIGQIMGLNAQIAGFNDVGEMINAMVESEDRQTIGQAQFLKHNGLNAHDWTRFARGYNGPNSGQPMRQKAGSRLCEEQCTFARPQRAYRADVSDVPRIYSRYDRRSDGSQDQVGPRAVPAERRPARERQRRRRDSRQAQGQGGLGQLRTQRKRVNSSPNVSDPRH